jgi:hypothetical protein
MQEFSLDLKFARMSGAFLHMKFVFFRWKSFLKMLERKKENNALFDFFILFVQVTYETIDNDNLL